MGAAGAAGFSIAPRVLPRLDGAWLVGFRLVWLAAFVVAILSSAGATWIAVRDSDSVGPGYAFGVRLSSPLETSGWKMGEPFGKDAVAAGIRAGDDLISISG